MNKDNNSDNKNLDTIIAPHKVDSANKSELEKIAYRLYSDRNDILIFILILFIVGWIWTLHIDSLIFLFIISIMNIMTAINIYNSSIMVLKERLTNDVIYNQLEHDIKQFKESAGRYIDNSKRYRNTLINMINLKGGADRFYIESDRAYYLCANCEKYKAGTDPLSECDIISCKIKEKVNKVKDDGGYL